FDGVDDTAVIADAPELQLGKDNADFSVAFWLNLQQGFNGLWRLLMQKGDGLNSRTFTFFLWPNANRLHYRLSTTTNPNEGGDSVALLATNTWTHVSLIKSGNRYRLFLNGVFDSERILPAPVLSNNQPLYLGDNPVNFGTKAYLDDLRLYSAALPTNLLAAVMASSLPTLIPPPFPLGSDAPEPAPDPADSSAFKSALALASPHPTDPQPPAPPRLTLSLDAATGQLLVQQVLDLGARATDWTWEFSDDLATWSPAPSPTLATSPDGTPILQLRLPTPSDTTRFFRARAR
ncbi:MAG: LamG domain-containing protein, partial [Verrucomicrobiales bacterium]|nr:LamG domain-containing protein [Verrucomicrobiales bacterium]